MAQVTPAHIDHALEAIRPYVRRTPIMEVAGGAFGIDATLVFKFEYMQESGSFKARGAAHFMTTQPVAPAGIVAASGGNHGAAVAWAAQRFGHRANIFVPKLISSAKLQRLHDYGASVHQRGEVYADAYAASEEFLAKTAATSVHAYDDPAIVAGAATCAKELESQATALDAVLLACGGGGLAGGAASWFGERVEVVACETAGTGTYAAALDAGGPVDVEVSGVAADALGATRIGAIPWEALSSAGATSAVVSDADLLDARDQLWRWLRVVVEPSAAAPVAALLQGQWRPRSSGSRIGIVLCGANTSLG